MKQQELDQLRQKSKAELLKDARQLQSTLVDLRIKKPQSTDLNVRKIGQTRKQLARVLTLIQTKD